MIAPYRDPPNLAPPAAPPEPRTTWSVPPGAEAPAAGTGFFLAAHWLLILTAPVWRGGVVPGMEDHGFWTVVGAFVVLSLVWMAVFLRPVRRP